MSEQFYTIMTNAPVLQTQVTFPEIAVGDSNGGYYTPTKDATTLRNKVWEGSISVVRIDE